MKISCYFFKILSFLFCSYLFKVGNNKKILIVIIFIELFFFLPFLIEWICINKTIKWCLRHRNFTSELSKCLCTILYPWVVLSKCWYSWFSFVLLVLFNYRLFLHLSIICHFNFTKSMPNIWMPLIIHVRMKLNISNTFRNKDLHGSLQLIRSTTVPTSTNVYKRSPKAYYLPYEYSSNAKVLFVFYISSKSDHNFFFRFVSSKPSTFTP